MKYKIIFLGPQGSGKGTQASLLTKKLQIPALSMGELLRARAADLADPRGKEIETILNAGDLVSDSLALETLKDHVEELNNPNGYLLDGYPRNVKQADTYLTFDVPTHIIVIEIPREESTKRLLKRAEIEHRSDDWVNIIEHRLDVYDKETKPLIDKFKETGLLHVIDGTGTIEEVHEAIMKFFV